MRAVILAIIFGFLPIESRALAAGYQLHEVGPIPLRSLLFLSKRGASPVVANPTPWWTSTKSFDSESQLFILGGRKVANPGGWGLMGLPSRPGTEARRTFGVSACDQSGGLSDTQRKTLWAIETYAVPVGEDGITWLYGYATNANDSLILPPYNSSFSQAAITHALLVAYCSTKVEKYRRLAIKAGNNLIAPIEDGGLARRTGDHVWFKEMPGPVGLTPYILNAHLYSVNVLYLLSEMVDESRFREAAEQGARTVQVLLPEFDTGYWSRYDLRPRYTNMYFEVRFDPKTTIKSIVVQKIGSDRPEGRYSLCDSGCDLTLPAARNDFSYRFPAMIEEMLTYAPGDPGLEVRVEYSGTRAPDIYVAGFRPGIKEVFKVKSKLGQNEVSAHVGVRDLGWHSTGDDYVKYHALLLEDLWSRVKDPALFVTAARFRNYVRVAENERKHETPFLKNRRFSLVKDDAADALLAKCFEDVAPTSIDIGTAAERLPTCAVDQASIPDLMARLGLVVESNAGASTISDGAATYAVKDGAVRQQ